MSIADEQKNLVTGGMENTLGTTNADGLSDFTQPSAAVQAKPSMGGVTSNQTVQGQMTGLMNSNNPLMQRAMTRASAAANKRGLLNSSMSTQAGQEAALTAALPIAEADAATNAKQAQLNQGFANEFSSKALDLSNKTSLLGTELSNQTKLADQSYGQEVGTGKYGATTTGEADYVGGGGLISSKTDAQKDLADQSYEQELGTGIYSALPTTENAGEYIGGGGLLKGKEESALNIQDDAQVQEEAMALLDADTRNELLTLQSNYDSLLQTNRSAATTWNTYLQAIVEIQQSSIENKDVVLQQLQDELIAGINVISAFDSTALAVPKDVDIFNDRDTKLTPDRTSPNLDPFYTSPSLG
jgi:hypothetical protein